MPDPVLFVKTFDHLILAAARAATANHPQVAIFGECVHLLWAQGNGEAAIQIEKLGNQLTKASTWIFCAGISRGAFLAGRTVRPSNESVWSIQLCIPVETGYRSGLDVGRLQHTFPGLLSRANEPGKCRDTLAHHDASNPATGPFWVRRIPISLVPASILSRVPIW